MELHIALRGRRGFAEQLYRQVKDAILAGDLRPGDEVPSTRDLAKRLEISRNTAGVAYDRLVAEGFLSSRAGVGTYVNRDLRLAEARPAPVASGVRPLPVWDAMRERRTWPPGMSSSTSSPGIPTARRSRSPRGGRWWRAC
ncbi:Transcriptional regulator, GntR family domain [Alloactinosynnema sp. L-07]|uniref:GntR family transcriptional regulator n=1 Tax=Alloactinosynnema sp. L-07 TaxID=1653480 RepID=UPI00065EF5F8|nr:winged helix-turn-helix domain-containing protein [Alloactinosynnema sp. L-07]CRK58585.1 Transcriptional regulator, GntR family domain [Alloactinosynnema sp. L-07]